MELCGVVRLIAGTNPCAPVPHIVVDVYKKDDIAMQVEHELFGGKAFFYTNNRIDLVRSNGRMWLYISALYKTTVSAF